MAPLDPPLLALGDNIIYGHDRYVLNHCNIRVTHGHTDGRTDGILIARLRLHSMQRGKNDLAVYVNVAVHHCTYGAAQLVRFALRELREIQQGMQCPAGNA